MVLRPLRVEHATSQSLFAPPGCTNARISTLSRSKGLDLAITISKISELELSGGTPWIYCYTDRSTRSTPGIGFKQCIDTMHCASKPTCIVQANPPFWSMIIGTIRHLTLVLRAADIISSFQSRPQGTPRPRLTRMFVIAQICPEAKVKPMSIPYRDIQIVARSDVPPQRSVSSRMLRTPLVLSPSLIWQSNHTFRRSLRPCRRPPGFSLWWSLLRVGLSGYNV